MNKQNTKFGVLNTERNRMVTGHSGTGIFNTADGAKDLKYIPFDESADKFQKRVAVL